MELPCSECPFAGGPKIPAALKTYFQDFNVIVARGGFVCRMKVPDKVEASEFVALNQGTVPVEMVCSGWQAAGGTAEAINGAFA